MNLIIVLLLLQILGITPKHYLLETNQEQQGKESDYIDLPPLPIPTLNIPGLTPSRMPMGGNGTMMGMMRRPGLIELGGPGLFGLGGLAELAGLLGLGVGGAALLAGD
ncbi:ubiquitin domain-containing protein DSK2b isoform X2 [Eurytemora carolleeae]|uniref:ubiquitin domain-containing protein DSK2b isoform X2 n=1 Tax=Eurytemora carolleeae TaxID=1294199 RepID=UPI000C75C404|nr:ubiquitin domain-containing protein DSK2b isoform X2 [Eurytemora carolleeae]XP_023333568.1 ubiquitin domain-containing protein DSK2b isoform X2 [Eurytemora carolleeae]|eukprot:XP_023333567.1 ubiquitin domain-containing protein DSK2b-like isoform X2 [Eurytemora affinis]